MPGRSNKLSAQLTPALDGGRINPAVQQFVLQFLYRALDTAVADDYAGPGFARVPRLPDSAREGR
jgi:hypothetical protein